MAGNQEFAARIARIEARAKRGDKHEYAPLPEDIGTNPARDTRMGLLNGLFGRMVLLLAMVAFIGGAFFTELLALMPSVQTSQAGMVSSAAINANGDAGQTLSHLLSKN